MKQCFSILCVTSVAGWLWATTIDSPRDLSPSERAATVGGGLVGNAKCVDVPDCVVDSGTPCDEVTQWNVACPTTFAEDQSSANNLFCEEGSEQGAICLDGSPQFMKICVTRSDCTMTEEGHCVVGFITFRYAPQSCSWWFPE